MCAGGCCRVCGSVEHFQKDCPEHQAASESLRSRCDLRHFHSSALTLSPLCVLVANSVTVGWLSNNMSADHEEVHVPVKKAKSKQTKVVMFWSAETTHRLWSFIHIHQFYWTLMNGLITTHMQWSGSDTFWFSLCIIEVICNKVLLLYILLSLILTCCWDSTLDNSFVI